MRFQWKVVTFVTAVVAISAFVVIWRTQSVVVADKLNFVADSAVKQVAPIKRLVDAKLAQAQNELVRFAASRASNGPGRETNFGPFDVVALIETSAAGNAGVTWTERGASAKSDAWPYGHDLTLLKSLPYSKVRDGQRHWVRVADGKGGPVYALIVSVEMKTSETPAAAEAQASANLPDGVGANASKPSRTKAYIVGFSTENPLAAITEDFIGSISNVYVVDDRGYVASHVDKTYNGALFTEDPIVIEIMKGQKAIGGGRFEDLESRPVIGHFEKVDDSNLTAIIAVPVRAAINGADEHLQTAIFTALGLTLAAAVAAWFAGGFMAPPTAGPVIDLGSTGLARSLAADDEEDEPMTTVRPSIQMYPDPIEPRREAVATDASLQNERKVAYENFQDGIAKQMREPVLSILGHAQLIRANVSPDDPIQAHVESIERDARNAKESLDRLRLFDQTDVPLDPNETLGLEDVVTRTLEAKSVDLQAAGVTVERKLGEVPRITGRASDLQVALTHMIDNSIEAMRERPVRRLTIETETRGDFAALVVRDTGVGMTREVKNRAFEPFFKGFQSPMRMGLGLSYVHAVAHRIDAKCEIETVPGDGTTITMKFPLQRATTEVAAEVAANVTVPKVPPPKPNQAEIDESVKRLLTLGGRGPIDDANGGLPPMPYPSLERVEDEAPSEPVVATPEPAVEAAPAVDAAPVIEAKPIDSAIEDVPQNEDDESESGFSFAALHEPLPNVTPDSSSNISTGIDFVEPAEEKANPPPAAKEVAAQGAKPFRVRIRPPRARGPNSQA